MQITGNKYFNVILLFLPDIGVLALHTIRASSIFVSNLKQIYLSNLDSTFL